MKDEIERQAGGKIKRSRIGGEGGLDKEGNHKIYMSQILSGAR
jgi:hypothetical protein